MKRPANQCNPRPHARLQVVARAVRDDLHTPIRYRVSFVPGLTQPAPGPAAAAAGPAPASAAPAAGAAAGSATSGGTQGRVHAPTATVAIMDRRYNPASLMETYLGVPAARVAQGISWDPADPNQLHMDLPEGTQASVFFWGVLGMAASHWTLQTQPAADGPPAGHAGEAVLGLGVYGLGARALPGVEALLLAGSAAWPLHSTCRQWPPEGPPAWPLARLRVSHTRPSRRRVTCALAECHVVCAGDDACDAAPAGAPCTRPPDHL